MLGSSSPTRSSPPSTPTTPPARPTDCVIAFAKSECLMVFEFCQYLLGFLRDRFPLRGSRRLFLQRLPIRAQARGCAKKLSGKNTRPSMILRVVRTIPARRTSNSVPPPSVSRRTSMAPEGCSMRTVATASAASPVTRSVGGRATPLATVAGIDPQQATQIAPVTAWAA